MREIRVASWNELLDRLYEGSWQEPIGRFRSHFAFRGLPSADFDLSTGLVRLGGAPRQLEGHLLRNFRKYALRDVPAHDSIWSWLAVAQHHGLPTRLVDWTYSPFVALHFATCDPRCRDCDAAVWCVDFVAANRLLPESLRGLLAGEGSDVFTVEMLSQAARSLAEFDALAPTPFVVFLEPPSLDERIVNQSALFSLMSSPTAALHDWLASGPPVGRRVIVPAALKREVRDKLDQANVTERVLFPGLDGLSRWLQRYYAPTP